MPTTAMAGSTMPAAPVATAADDVERVLVLVREVVLVRDVVGTFVVDELELLIVVGIWNVVVDDDDTSDEGELVSKEVVEVEVVSRSAVLSVVTSATAVEVGAAEVVGVGSVAIHVGSIAYKLPQVGHAPSGAVWAYWLYLYSQFCSD